MLIDTSSSGSSRFIGGSESWGELNGIMEGSGNRVFAIVT
jgi:hypothetical protein